MSTESTTELVELRAAMASLQDEVGRLRTRQPGPAARRRRTVRRGLVAATLVALLAGYAGLTGAIASPQHNAATGFSFVPLPAWKKVLTTTVSPFTTKSVAVTAGTTTVPPNATVVGLNVTVKGGAAAGALPIYPTGNPYAQSFPVITWNGGQTVSGDAEVSPGLSGQASFTNNSQSTVTLTVNITGYSDQISDRAITATDGSAGQILTNSGTGAYWQTPPFAMADTATTVIHPTGDDRVDGTSLRDALVTGANKVVAIEPGTYELGSTPLQIASGVTLVGAGSNESIVNTEGSITMSGAGGMTGVGLNLGSAAEVFVAGGQATFRNDTITGTGGDAIFVTTGSAVIDDTTVTNQADGFNEDVLLNSSQASVTVRNSTLSATMTGTASDQFATGVEAHGPATIYDSRITSSGPSSQNTAVSGGFGGSITIEGSELHTSSGGYALSTLNADIHLANSQVDGLTSATSGATITCVGAYSAVFAALNSSCVAP